MMQATAGKAFRFWWRPAIRPVAAAAVPPAPATPFVRFADPIGESVALARVGELANVQSVDATRTVLTFDAPIGAFAGLLGEQGGAAWLDMGGAYQGPVTVASVLTATTALLAKPLPLDVGAATGTLEWRIWYADLDAGQVGDAVARGVPWSIEWQTAPGDALPAEYRTDNGLIDIVRRPFSTGLTHDRLLESFSLLRSRIPAGQTSLEPQIRAALREMLRYIAPKMNAGEHVDMLDGAQFEPAHALFAAHVITRDARAATYDGGEHDFLKEARDLIRLQFQRLEWLDANSDGEAADGEKDLRRASPRPTTVYSFPAAESIGSDR